MAKKQRKKAARRPLCYTHVGVQVAPTKRSTHDPAAALSHRQTEVAMAQDANGGLVDAVLVEFWGCKPINNITLRSQVCINAF